MTFVQTDGQAFSICHMVKKLGKIPSAVSGCCHVSSYLHSPVPLAKHIYQTKVGGGVGVGGGDVLIIVEVLVAISSIIMKQTRTYPCKVGLKTTAKICRKRAKIQKDKEAIPGSLQ